MIEFFKDIGWLVRDASGDWMGRILLVLTAVLAIFIAFLILLGGFWVIDTSFQDYRESKAVVCSRYFVPAHTDTGFIMAGKVMVPTSTYYPDAWYIGVTMNGKVDASVSVPKNYFDTLIDGQTVNAKYRIGRLSRNLYVQNIWP